MNLQVNQISPFDVQPLISSYASLNQILIYIVSQKRMLKGLKKTKIIQHQQMEDAVKPRVNQSHIKSQHIHQQQNEQHDVYRKIEEEDKKAELKRYQHCLQLYLNGSSEQLIHEIDALKKYESQKNTESNPVKQVAKGKFEYNMDFEGQDNQKDKVKKQIKKRNRPIMASNRVQDYCMYCPDNEDLTLISASNYVYLALPKYRTFDNLFHFILAPVDHEQTSIGLNQDILTEITNYKKCLIQAFDKYDLQMVFFEQFSKENTHIYIQCLALPRIKAQDLPFFFKQALQDIEGNWNTHKNIIRIEKQRGGLQKQIPKQIKYFYIDFSNGYGYAHVIQNQKFWKREFCYEVFATAMNMEIHKIKTTQTFSPEEYQKKRENFKKIWKAFDWTELI